jgi:hypothetical protein
MFHGTKNCEIKCFFYLRLGHSKDMCSKKPKDGKSNSKTTKFWEVLMDDEKVNIQQLNKLCGNENFFSYTWVPRRRMLIEVASCHNPSLGLATKARGCKVAGQEGSPGVMPHAHESARECEGIDPHTPKGTPTLGVRVPVDSRMFTKWLQGSKLNGLKSSL